MLALLLAHNILISNILLSGRQGYGCTRSTASVRTPFDSSVVPFTTIPGTPMRLRAFSGSCTPLHAVRTT